MHRIHWPKSLPGPGQQAIVAEDEAAHALRVKRLRIGDPVQLLDGLGSIADGTVAALGTANRRASLSVYVTAIGHVPELLPRVEIWAATPKGARVDEMVEGLSEVGAASWTPLRSSRSIVEPRPTKLDRLSRLAIESSKQCGRAWLLRILPERLFMDAILPAPDTLILLADSSGTPLGSPTSAPPPSVRVLVGPEGGWTPEELAQAHAAAVPIISFGPHAMRIETAAVAIAAITVDRLSPPAP